MSRYPQIAEEDVPRSILIGVHHEIRWRNAVHLIDFAVRGEVVQGQDAASALES